MQKSETIPFPEERSLNVKEIFTVMLTARNTHNQRENHLRDSKRLAQRLYCIVCTKASGSCVDSEKKSNDQEDG